MSTFRIRGLNLVESVLRHDEGQLRRFIRRMKDLHLNTLMTYYDYGWSRYGKLIIEETSFAGVDLCLAVFAPRTFFSYAGWRAEWSAKNPDGSAKFNKLECETKPCRFEPEAMEAYKFGVEQWLSQLPPEIKHVHIRSGDGIQFCECPRCKNLPAQEQWQPFLDAFAEVLLEIRPQLSFEVDVYVKRYQLPEQFAAQRRASRIMFDTFGRQGFVPLGKKSWNTDVMSLYVSEPYPNDYSPNEYLCDKLREWNTELPKKVYVHENLMGQGLLSINQHNTGVLLEDLKTYREIGVQGVAYEAYEPGFEHFAEQISILSQAMNDIKFADEYIPDELEKELTGGGWRMSMFCNDIAFPVDKYIKDPVVRQHIKNYRDFLNNPNTKHLRKLVEFVFENDKRFDFLFAGFHGCDYARVVGNVDFSDASEHSQFMLAHRKLWDFMETIPADANPRSITRELILDAVAHAKDRR